jgi:hypothetical protein
MTDAKTQPPRAERTAHRKPDYLSSCSNFTVNPASSLDLTFSAPTPRACDR